MDQEPLLPNREGQGDEKIEALSSAPLPPRDQDSINREVARWRSIKTMYVTNFLNAVGFSIVMTSVWPYLLKLDGPSSKPYLGLVIAAFSIGQVSLPPVF